MQRNIFTSIVSLLIFIGATFVQAKTVGESPEQGLRAIVELFKNKDWTGLVEKRCLDARHAGSVRDFERLASSLDAQFSDTDRLAEVIDSYEAALATSPRIESAGSLATFSSQAGLVRLSKMENGAWGMRF